MPPLSPRPACVRSASMSAWRKSWTTDRPPGCRSAVLRCLTDGAVRLAGQPGRRVPRGRAGPCVRWPRVVRRRRPGGRGRGRRRGPPRAGRPRGPRPPRPGPPAPRPRRRRVRSAARSSTTRARGRASRRAGRALPASVVVVSASSSAAVTSPGAVSAHVSRVRWASIPPKPPVTTSPARGARAAGAGGPAPRAHAACSRRGEEPSDSRSSSAGRPRPSGSAPSPCTAAMRTRPSSGSAVAAARSGSDLPSRSSAAAVGGRRRGAGLGRPSSASRTAYRAPPRPGRHGRGDAARGGRSPLQRRSGSSEPGLPCLTFVECWPGCLSPRGATRCRER